MIPEEENNENEENNNEEETADRHIGTRPPKPPKN